MKKLIIAVLLVTLFLPVVSVAEEDTSVMNYRLNVENHWYTVEMEYDYINLHYLLFTMDAVFSDQQQTKEDWSRQLDEHAVQEVWAFFHEDVILSLEYTDQVHDYLTTYFDEDELEGGGFFQEIGNFFSWIADFFRNLF